MTETETQQPEMTGEPDRPAPAAAADYTRVAKVRKAARMQIDACAKALGVSPALWSSLEKKGVPSPDEMIAAVKKASDDEKKSLDGLFRTGG